MARRSDRRSNEVQTQLGDRRSATGSSLLEDRGHPGVAAFWLKGTWLRLRSKYQRLNRFFSNWVIAQSYPNSNQVELLEPNGLVVWDRKKAENLYAVARTGKAVVSTKVSVGMRTTQAWCAYYEDEDLRVHKVVEVRGDWVKTITEDTLMRNEASPYQILHVKDFTLKYTPHLNRFQRELDF